MSKLQGYINVCDMGTRGHSDKGTSGQGYLEPASLNKYIYSRRVDVVFY